MAGAEQGIGKAAICRGLRAFEQGIQRGSGAVWLAIGFERVGVSKAQPRVIGGQHDGLGVDGDGGIKVAGGLYRLGIGSQHPCLGSGIGRANGFALGRAQAEQQAAGVFYVALLELVLGQRD